MAIPKLVDAQTDFSAGEIDVSAKRDYRNPEVATGSRQLSNFRLLNTRKPRNRPGRSALLLELGRVEEVQATPTLKYYLVFGNVAGGYLRVYNAAGTKVLESLNQPWTLATIGKIVWVPIILNTMSIYITFPGITPIVLSFDGVSVWSIATFAEEVVSGGQKRTLFYRISPLNVTMLPSATTGNITLTFSSAVLVAGQANTRMRFCNRQLLITSVNSSTTANATVIEPLPPGQTLTTSASVGSLNIGDEIIGATSGATGIVTQNAGQQTISFGSPPSLGTFQIGDTVTGSISSATGTVTSIFFGFNNVIANITVLLSSGTFQASEVITGSHGSATSTSVTSTTLTVQLLQSASGTVVPFIAETAVGPSGNVTISAVATTTPQAVSIWDDEVMNSFRGFPQSVFSDQGRIGFCNFPALPAAVAWSAIGAPTDFYIAAFPSSAILELVSDAVQVLFVVPGMEGSEFVFTNGAIYYIPINVTNPLKPGSVAFNKLSQHGCAPNVEPRRAEQSIVYVKAGLTQIGAVQVPGAYYRPYVVDNISEMHAHLFTTPTAIAVPSGSSQFEELYIYILNSSGTLAVGKYAMKGGLIDTGPEGKPHVGWVPWSGGGTVNWVSALSSDVLFNTSYPGASNGMVEILDATQYLDAAISVNALPAALAAPAGKGPLWWLPSATVFLIDLGTRFMGIYQTDANGNIIPQNIDGENLLSAQLVAGQPWTATMEPFVPPAQSGGTDAGQRMKKRRLARAEFYVQNSTGFRFDMLAAGEPLGRNLPAAGVPIRSRRVPTWNQDDDPTQPAPLREQAYAFKPLGRAHDPRCAIVKDTPGPLDILEAALRVTV